MSFFDPLNATQFPLTAQGKAIVNSFGIIIGTMTDTTTAQAVVHVANAGVPTVKAEVLAYYKKENHKAGILARSKG